MERDQETPGTLLALLMRRRGWSAPRLSEIAGGVSASSIRAYLSDRTAPRPDHALALARAVGPLDGKLLLELWGYTDLAHGFYEEWRAVGNDDRVERMTQAYYRFNHVEYAGDLLSGPGLDLVRSVAAWVQHIEQMTATPPQARPRRTPSPTESEEGP